MEIGEQRYEIVTHFLKIITAISTTSESCHVLLSGQEFALDTSLEGSPYATTNK